MVNFVVVISFCLLSIRLGIESFHNTFLESMQIYKTYGLKKFLEKEKLGKITLFSINDSLPEIRVDLKYATSDNFTKKVLYFSWKKAYVQNEVALKLKKAQSKLNELSPGAHLLIYDAARPLSVQIMMWNALDSIPVSRRTKFLSPPGSRSLHNYACAVDITICDSLNVPLDMGAGYDDPRTIAYPSMETYFLEKGELTKQHISNRKLLRTVMNYSGFKGISTEWWHFNAFQKKEAVARFPLIESESSINQ